MHVACYQIFKCEERPWCVVLFLATEAHRSAADRYWPASCSKSFSSEAGWDGESSVQGALWGGGSLSAPAAGAETETYQAIQATAAAQLRNHC